MTDFCFAFKNKLNTPINYNQYLPKIDNIIRKIFENSNIFKNQAFNNDELKYLEIYPSLLWKRQDKKRLYIHLNTTNKDTVHKYENITEYLKTHEIKIDEKLSLYFPALEHTFDIERYKIPKGKPSWKTLEHNGPFFGHILDPYVPIGYSILYNKKMYKLTPTEEQYALLYAKRIIADQKNSSKAYTLKPQFNENFWNDFQTILSDTNAKIFKDFDKLDFTPIVESLLDKKDDIGNEKVDTEEDKKSRQIQKLIDVADYGICYVDGRVKQVKSYIVEPYSFYIGKGGKTSVENQGRVKVPVNPDEVTINVSKGLEPQAPGGYNWKNIEHDPKKRWLSSYKDKITGKDKYVYVTDSPELLKFEKARKLNKLHKEVVEKYTSLITSKSAKERQIGTVIYLIDNFGIRPGNHPDDDVHGATTLTSAQALPRISSQGRFGVMLKFIGKDNILYSQICLVTMDIYNNLIEFRRNKKDNQQIFDMITANDVNRFLQTIDVNFTSKVFRTRLASSKMYGYLKDFCDDKKAVLKAKVDCFKDQNLKVAKVLNHKKEKFNKSQEQSHDYALNTSLKDYIDPRIVKSWVYSSNIEDNIDKIYSPALQKNVQWALKDSKVNAKWDYISASFD